MAQGAPGEETKSKEDCMQLFADILDVQKEREIGFIQMEIDVKALEAGKMSVRKFRKRRVEWQKKENVVFTPSFLKICSILYMKTPIFFL